MAEELRMARISNTYVATRARQKVKALSADDFQKYVQSVLAPAVGEILATAQRQAIEGDDKARTFLFERAYGKVAQNMAISGSVEHKYTGQVNIAVLAAQAALQLKAEKT